MVKNCIISFLLAVCLVLSYSYYNLSKEYAKEHVNHVVCQATMWAVSVNMAANGLSILDYQSSDNVIQARAGALLKREQK